MEGGPDDAAPDLPSEQFILDRMLHLQQELHTAQRQWRFSYHHFGELYWQMNELQQHIWSLMGFLQELIILQQSLVAHRRIQQ